MNAPGWLTQHLADVPAGDAWLTAAERRTLAGLQVAPRRAAWRLGRWTAKMAIGLWLEVAPEDVEILAADDGAPDAWLEGTRLPLSVSLSHRSDRALAVIVDAPGAAGCDLEVVEPRSGAFVREWLAPVEQVLVATGGEDRQALLANLIWTAKEAAAKVRRQGLRLDLRRAEVELADPGAAAGSWSALRVQWDDDGPATTGWWRWEAAWVMTVAGEPPPERPRPLAAP